MDRLNNLGRWGLRLITWDGLLPATVWTIPFVLHAAAPDRRGPIEIAAIVLPVVGVFVRFCVGTKHIRQNGCGDRMRTLQTVLLCVGIFILFAVDALVILSYVMPEQDGPPPEFSELLILGAVLGTYWTMMAIAMYPGPWRPAGVSASRRTP